MSTLETGEKYPSEILNRAYQICEKIWTKQLFADIFRPDEIGEQHIINEFSKLLKKDFPSLNDDQCAELYDYGMHTSMF